MIRLRKLKSSTVLVAALAAQILTAHAARAQDQPLEPSQIVMPSRVVAGQPATLAVLDNTGRLVPKVSVMLSDGTPTETDATGRATFKVPRASGIFTARLAAHNEIDATSVILPYLDSAQTQIQWAPALISIHDRFEIRGMGFRGDAAGNTVEFAQQPALVLAASQAALVILPNPSAKPGTAQLSVTVNGTVVTATLAALLVEFDAGKAAYIPGTRTALTVRVRGTDRPQEVDVENLAPAVMHFAHGDLQHVRTHGGVDNSAIVIVRVLQPGDFSFRVRLTSMDPKSTDPEAARAYLIAAQKVASPPWIRRLDPLLARFEDPKPDTRKALLDLNHMLAGAPPENLRVLMLAARDALRTK